MHKIPDRTRNRNPKRLLQRPSSPLPRTSLGTHLVVDDGLQRGEAAQRHGTYPANPLPKTNRSQKLYFTTVHLTGKLTQSRLCPKVSPHPPL